MATMTATEFCQHVENRLGWMPPAMGYRRYQVEAAKVKRKMATDPALYTFENLMLTVELLWRERLARTPMGVFAHVGRAIEMAVETEDDVELAIRQATAHEESRGDPAGWVVRFARAQGKYRLDALTEWRESIR